MTQKELLYLEDAIGHEKNIISICRDSVERIDDENLVSFMNSEIEKHQGLMQKLLTKMEEKANEQSVNNG